jgi:hypothetical protein
MRNLYFTKRSLQFSEFAHKSLGSSFSLPPLFFFSPSALSTPWLLSLSLLFDRRLFQGIFPLPPSLSSTRRRCAGRRAGAGGSATARLSERRRARGRRQRRARRIQAGRAGGRPATRLRLQAGGAEAELERGRRCGAELSERWRTAPGELARWASGERLGRLGRSRSGARLVEQHEGEGDAQRRRAGGAERIQAGSWRWRVRVQKLIALAMVRRGAAVRRRRRGSVAGVGGVGERAQKELQWRTSARDAGT